MDNFFQIDSQLFVSFFVVTDEPDDGLSQSQKYHSELIFKSAYYVIKE